MRKRKIRSLITCFLILMMVVSFVPEASAGEIRNLSKTVSSTPDENGELKITLTVSGETFEKDQPLNLLLVIDLSNSMNNKLSGNTTRLQALKNAFAENENNFIDSLQDKVGSGNLFVDIVVFDSFGYNKLSWTNNMETVKSTIKGLQIRDGATDNSQDPDKNKRRGGTNYQDALAKAQVAAESKNDVHVIFLSDGEPTFYSSNPTWSNGTSCSVTNLEQTLTQMQSYQDDSNITFRAAIAYATSPTFTTDSKYNSDSRTYYRYDNVSLLGLAKSNVKGTYQTYRNGSWSNGSADRNLENREIHTIGYDAYEKANNEAELVKSLDAIAKGFNLSSVSITDPMHETHIQENINLQNLREEKLQVYLVPEEGSVQQLTYGKDYTVNGDTINYIPELKAGETLKVVATVQISDSPGAYYFEKQDYPKEDADANPGFLSNKTASASGMVDGESYTGSYLNPVFKLNTTSLTIQKVNAADSSQKLSGATFEITRKPFNNASGSSCTRTETYKTREDGTVIIPDLPYGDYVLNETAAPNGFKILESPLTFSVNYLGQITTTDERLTNLTGSASDGYSATVTNDPNDVTLTVTKNLEGTAKNPEDAFPFELTATKYLDYVTDDQKVDNVSQTIGQGGAITIRVPYGTTVKVSETDSKGYKATVDTAAITDWESDRTGYSGTIELTEDTEITITNTKNAPVVTGFVTDSSGTSGIALVSITMISLGALLIYLKKRHF